MRKGPHASLPDTWCVYCFPFGAQLVSCDLGGKTQEKDIVPCLLVFVYFFFLVCFVIKGGGG